jgi:hypothetical protein
MSGSHTAASNEVLDEAEISRQHSMLRFCDESTKVRYAVFLAPEDVERSGTRQAKPGPSSMATAGRRSAPR